MKSKIKENQDRWTRKEVYHYEKNWSKIIDFIESLGFEFDGSLVQKNFFVKGSIKKFYWTIDFYKRD